MLFLKLRASIRSGQFGKFCFECLSSERHKIAFSLRSTMRREKKIAAIGLCVFCKLYNLSEYREPGKLDTYLGNLGDSCLLHFIREFHKMECSFVCKSYYEWQGLQKYLAPQSNSKEVLSTTAEGRIYALAHWDASFSAFVLCSVVLLWTWRWSGLHQHDLKNQIKKSNLVTCSCRQTLY